MNKREYQIPEGYEARIEGNKVIFEPKESEDERMIRIIEDAICTDEAQQLVKTKYGLELTNLADWLEKQGLQNLDNSAKTCKVEPKFKVGDWVVQQGVGIFKIIEICKSWYEVIDCTGNRYSIAFLLENGCHLWTIQDAKDGDVLTTDIWTFIFKKYQDKSVCYHCAASEFNNFSISDTGEFDSNYVHPATKEQRDILFQKMKEAGYEWDAEKKELRKIEQNPAWSEEDEQYLLVCKNALAKYQTTDKWDAGIISHWLEDRLKSLKERYTWKPSEEQIIAIRLARSFVADDFSDNPTLSEILIELENQLKKLKG